LNHFKNNKTLTLAIFYNYINANKLLNLYKQFLSFLSALNAGILKIPGNKLSPNGYNIDKAKLNKVSLININ
jgi:hypothetical protein